VINSVSFLRKQESSEEKAKSKNQKAKSKNKFVFSIFDTNTLAMSW